MFANTQSVTIGIESVSLNRVNQDNYTGKFFGKRTTGEGVTLSIAHTLPPSGGTGESHFIRLDVEHLTGAVVDRIDSVWQVMKTTKGVQADVGLLEAQKALSTFLSAVTFQNAGVLAARRS